MLLQRSSATDNHDATWSHVQAIADATAAIEHAESRFQGLVVRGKALLLAGRAEEAVRDLTVALHVWVWKRSAALITT